MPQMAPMDWVSLYILFIWVFILINIVNFYIFLYKPSMKMTPYNLTISKWKW